MEKEHKPAWEKVRDWASFSMSFVAFVISVLVGYYTTIRGVDEVRVRVGSEPKLSVRPNDKRIEASGDLSLVFINSGTRPIAIVGVYVYFGQAKEPYPYSLCGGVGFSTDLEPLVIEEKKIASRTLNLREEPFAKYADVRLERQTSIHLRPGTSNWRKMRMSVS